MLSLVLTGRNDNYGGCFEERLMLALTRNAELLDEHGVDFEVVFIEWNPLHSTPLLSETLCQRFRFIRSFVVPKSVHEEYCTHPTMPFCEMAAKNIGIRQARGDRLLILNADVILSRSIVERIASIVPCNRALYRARRVDVRSDFDSQALQDESFDILFNGEERLPPVKYLGAGGDFCYGAKTAFLHLGGFDESIRFSTRAKDWQFYLGALRRGFEIEFIGHVFHIDHGEGFRHTSKEIRDSGIAHFGGYWNIEARCPYENPDTWGMEWSQWERLGRSRAFRMREDCVPDKLWSREADTRDKMEVQPSSASSGRKGALLLHLALWLSFDRSSEMLGIEFSQPDTICQWRSLCFAIGLDPETRSGEGALAAPLIVETADGFRLECDEGRVSQLVESWARVGEPEFNPLLLCRLARAYRFFLDNGTCRILLFGAGSHSQEVQSIGVANGIELVGILDSVPSSSSWGGLVCLSPQDSGRLDYDGVLLSSISFESEMALCAKEHALKNVYELYGYGL